MIDKVWVVYMEIGMDDVKIHDDTVYLSKDKADKMAKALNKGSIYRFYVDYLDVAKD